MPASRWQIRRRQCQPHPSAPLQFFTGSSACFLFLTESESLSTTSLPSCPQCGLENTYPDGDLLICPDCAHEWSPQAEAAADEDSGARIIKDANGTPLADGDSVLLVKDLKVKGSSTVIKKGTKIKGIRLVYDNGDHDVDCKTDQGPFILKSEFLKKA